MRRIIVNADDCGKSIEVNQAIGKAIQGGKLSSTTIMANMSDLSGACRLYDAYHDTVSFGWHMNLTEGRPIKGSQFLLDKGFYVETDDGIRFNAQQFERSRFKLLNKRLREDIFSELCAQFEVLADHQISISHVDSHHHVHTSLYMFMILPELLKRCHLHKMRNIRNTVPFSLSFLGRKAWTLMQKASTLGVIMPDFFEDYSRFDLLYSHNKSFISNEATVELMCHPGHPLYHDDELLFRHDVEIDFQARLISYHEL